MAWLEKKKNGRFWRAVWKKDGKKIRKTTTVEIGVGKKNEAKSRQEAQKQADMFELASTGKTPFNKLIDALRRTPEAYGMDSSIPSVRKYLANIPRTSSMSSERNRERAFTVFLDYLGDGADMRIDLLTTEICRGFVRKMLESVSRGTVGIYKVYLSGAFKRAVEIDDYLLKNPFAGVNMGAEAREVIPERGADKQEKLPFTLEEIRFMIHSFPDPWRDMVAVSFFLGGLRLSDVCKLRWDAINWKKRVVTYTEVKTRQKRVQPFGTKLEEIFDRRRKQCDGLEEYVFPDMAHAYDGSSKTGISTQFTALLRAYGMIEATGDAGKLKGNRKRVNQKSFHSIRHAAVTYFHGGFTDGRSNYSPEMIMKFIGHSSLEVERGYITASVDAKRPMEQSMEDAIFSEPKETPKAPRRKRA